MTLFQLPEHVERIGMVARWQPVHRGHEPVLRGLCNRADVALIGIGSANRHDARSPFTADETADMLSLALAGFDNYRLLEVPDVDDGPRWRGMVVELFGELDVFVTDNPYVANLLDGVYRVIRPVELLPADERVPISGTLVRIAMARGEHWQDMVSQEIAGYLVAGGLDDRFRREFGLRTLALGAIIK